MTRLDRTTAVLAAILVPIALATVVGLVALWPSGQTHETGIVEVDAEHPTARVLSATSESCGGENEDRLPDGSIPESVPCTTLRAEVTSGDAAGQVVEVWAPATVRATDLPPGTAVVLVRYLATDVEPEVWAWYDFSRSVPLGVLALAFAAVVVAGAGSGASSSRVWIVSGGGGGGAALRSLGAGRRHACRHLPPLPGPHPRWQDERAALPPEVLASGGGPDPERP